jgi:hypothetical protein
MKEKTGQIYILHNEMYNYYGENIYKIGTTKNIKTRTNSYETYYIEKCNVRIY